MKPLIRWCGGKSWLVDQVVPEIQASPFSTYHEPFVGAGAVALALGGTPKMVLSDFCAPLVNLWNISKRHPEVLANEASKVFSSYGNTKEGYTKARDKFNSSSKLGVASAALMLYLNRVCFNGLWRENSSGHMNVPFGDVKRPRVSTVEELRRFAAKLKNTEIRHASYQQTIPLIQKGDVGFFDPPYDQGYVGYVSSGFTEEDQRNLAQLSKEAYERGARLWITNSDTPLIREIYAWAEIHASDEPRAIAAKSESRKPAKCLVIRADGALVHGIDRASSNPLPELRSILP